MWGAKPGAGRVFVYIIFRGTWLLYSVALASATQRSESATGAPLSSPLGFLPV